MGERTSAPRARRVGEGSIMKGEWGGGEGSEEGTGKGRGRARAVTLIA